MKLTKNPHAKRVLVAGLLAGSGLLAASSFAMTALGPSGKAGCEARHGQKTHADWEARRTQHLSELKEMLELKPEQEAAWESFSKAGVPQERFDDQARRDFRGEMESLNTPQRLDEMLAMLEMRRARFAERAEAIKAFYAQLTPEQQSVFDAESRLGRHRSHGHQRFQS